MPGNSELSGAAAVYLFGLHGVHAQLVEVRSHGDKPVSLSSEYSFSNLVSRNNTPDTMFAIVPTVHPAINVGGTVEGWGAEVQPTPNGCGRSRVRAGV